MLRDWALDTLLRTERPGTIGHMIGGFLYDEPALGLEENEINEGIRIFCFLTRRRRLRLAMGKHSPGASSVWTDPVSSTPVGAPMPAGTPMPTLSPVMTGSRTPPRMTVENPLRWSTWRHSP